MSGYLLRRLLQLPLIMVIIYALTCFLLMATPGDPLQQSERELTVEQREKLLAYYNYDQPWYKRYFYTWPKRLIVTGDLPAHRYSDWTVVEIIRISFPVSLTLGLFSLLLAVIGGTLIGIIAAARHNTWLDHATIVLSLIGISLPTFVIGAVLLLVFSLWLGFFPVGGWGRISQIILPGVTLSLPFMAYIARFTRAGMLDVLGSDFIRTARAKGLTSRSVLLKHAFKNAFLPVLSFLGPAAAAIFTGSFVVEKIFNIPGIGTHVVESVSNRDQSLVLGCVLLYAFLLVIFNLLVDLMYAFVDPRIKIGK